ncbi:ATP-dependent DNA helicase-like protein II [Boeremia exigua]|uniref:ATP-dependent DNA helicase-like protein II n=1 Tax=Boeremia exigua TaxID=749465 RepID=UPI001E8E0818|nr:ATP-dependent DNA helicase-like protein II [Boeremia exigua]KAH6633693.1 ATP-dependent DNA helicase-like protein II [Boeremia exigua]
MAGKEATIYILDLGASMGRKRHGRDHTDLDWALDYVWDKITTTVCRRSFGDLVATGRKTALMSVVGCRTDETDLNGVMEEAEGYENITVFSELKQYLLGDIRRLQEKLKPSKTNDGDLVSALAVAVHLMDSATQNKAGKPLKYDRRIIIVTDGNGEMDGDDLADIAAKIKDVEAPIEIVLLGVDFDDPDFGYKEEDKETTKAENEEVLKSFIDNCDGNFGTLAEAIEQLDIPRLKQTRPVPSYRGPLTLGDAAKYDATLTIDVERYPCTMLAKPPTASSFVVRGELGAAGPSDEPSNGIVGEDHPMSDLAAVRHQRGYQVEDPNEPGAKKNVDMEDLEKGFEYGRTAVHVAESDMNVIKLETSAAFEIIGFIREEEFDRFMPMSRTNYIVPQKGNQQAQLALSSFIHALHEGELNAVARFVSKENKPPIVLLLSPRIEPDFECLVDVELPFEEDIRRYKFPPLDRKLTVSGKVITEHRDLPTADLTSAMDAYVDAMDLSTFAEDEDGNPDEYAKPEDTYAPLVHRINHIIRWRATHPDPTLPIPDPPAILTKYSTPPSDLTARTARALATLTTAADLKKVPPKAKGRGKRLHKERATPLSGLDVSALLGTPSSTLDPANLVPSFKQALSAASSLADIQSAADAMAVHIRRLVRDSVGDAAYGQALEALGVMREELAEMEEPEVWNSFVRVFKGELLGGGLGGERREMWWRVRGGRCGLIDQRLAVVSEVSEKEAEAFYRG